MQGEAEYKRFSWGLFDRDGKVILQWAQFNILFWYIWK